MKATCYEHKGTGCTSFVQDGVYTEPLYTLDELNSAMIRYLATLDNEREDEWWGTEQEIEKIILVKFREYLILGQSNA